MWFSFRPKVLALFGVLAIISVAVAAPLTVSWDDNSTSEAGFRIERSVAGGSFDALVTVGANVTNYTDSNVSAGKTYAYRVAAYDATTTSSFSNVATVTTPADVAATPGGGQPAPSNTSTPSSPSTVTEAPSPAQPTVIKSRIVNLSVRAVPGVSDRALIVGFVVSAATKKMLVRAVGPGLSTYTSAPVHSDPKLTLYNGTVIVGSNDDWGGSDLLKSTFNRLGAFPLPDVSKDAVVLTDFAPKPYSATVTGSASGLAMAEIYDADTATAPSGRLVNVSARANAGPGDGVLIVGFVISGDTPLRVLVRAIGPNLATAGVAGTLVDPQLSLYKGNALLQQNDNWGGSSELTAAFAKTGASKLPDATSKDAALIATLAPGAYTAIVSGMAGVEGIALAEVYEIGD